MKRLCLSALAGIFLLSTAHAQYEYDQTGYPGDFFSLEGAIELFKESRTLREFERKINSHDRYVNNLDLNYDGRTDYIRVEHRRSGNFHAIILQAPLGRRDIQDIAVIELEKTGRREAILQIIGDRDIYGEELIVEPIETYSYSGSPSNHGARYTTNEYVNVYYWPLVQYIFGRDYRIYASPYRWNVYPTWWSPWRPYSWNVYRPRIRNYFNTCRVVTVYRLPRVHVFYRPYRSYSHHVVKYTRDIRKRRGTAHIHRSRSPHGVVGKDGRIHRQSTGSNRVQKGSTGTRPKVHQPRTYGSSRSSARTSKIRSPQPNIRPKSQSSPSGARIQGQKGSAPKAERLHTPRRTNSSVTRPGSSRGTPSPRAKKQVDRRSNSTPRSSATTTKKQVRRPPTSAQGSTTPRAKQQVRRPTANAQRSTPPRRMQQVRRPSATRPSKVTPRPKQQVRRPSNGAQRNTSPRTKEQVRRASASSQGISRPRKTSSNVQRRGVPKHSSSTRAVRSSPGKRVYKTPQRPIPRKSANHRPMSKG